MKQTRIPAKGEIVTVRLSPRIKYALELCARKQHRNLSQVMGWAIEKILFSSKDGLIDEDGNNILDLLWDVDPDIRFQKLVTHKKEWLTFEEEVLLRTKENEDKDE